MTFTSDDAEFVAFCINTFGEGGHPEAEPANLRFFTVPYMVQCLQAATKAKLAEEHIWQAELLATELTA